MTLAHRTLANDVNTCYDVTQGEVSRSHPELGGVPGGGSERPGMVEGNGRVGENGEGKPNSTGRNLLVGLRICPTLQLLIWKLYYFCVC